MMKKYFFIFIFLILVSCYTQQKEELRIVDIKGNPARINKIVPEFNEEQMRRQKQNIESKGNYTEINKFNQNYNDNNYIFYANDIESNIIKEENKPKEKKYPNDIFADRITNYKYIKDDNYKQRYNKNTDTDKKTTVLYDDTQEENIINNDVIVLDDFKPIEEKKNTKLKTKKLSMKNIETKKESTKTSKNVTNNTYYDIDNDNYDNFDKKYETENTDNYYIQLGVYSTKANAENVYRKYKRINIGSVENYNIGNSKKYKVVLGPYSSKKEAERDLEEVINTGHYDTYITKKK